MRSTNENSLDWLESCKQSLKVKDEKEAQTQKNDSTNSIDNSNRIDCLNNIEKENCELSSKNLKTDKKEKIYTINDIIDEKHLTYGASNEKNKNFTPIQNSSTSITNDLSLIHI